MKKRILTLCTAFFVLLPLTAQDLETGYFLGGNPFAFRLNPAFQSERNILSIGLGMTGAGAVSNMGINTLLYPDASGKKLYSFLNDRVAPGDFLSKLHKHNYLGADAQVNVLTVGFWSGRSFFTIDFNVRNTESASLPYDVFRLLKGDKSEGEVFECKTLGLQSNTFAEAAFGWSRSFGDNFRVGARMKVLMGVLEAQAKLRQMRVEIHEESWKVESHGTMVVSSPAVTVAEVPDTGSLDPDSFEFDWSKFGPAGWGGAVDLGFRWDATPLLTFSGAILDLGTVRWNREQVYSTPGVAVEWAPSIDAEEDPANDFKDEIADLILVAGNLLTWEKDPRAGAAFDLLPCRVNAGAELRMPFYDRLSVGALYQGRFKDVFARHTGRVSLNWNPLNWLSMSGSMGFNKFGESAGFALNLHPAGLNLVLGCDYIPFKCVDASVLLEDIDIPARYAILPEGRMNLDLYLALNIAFGRRRLDHDRRFIPSK